MEETILVSKMIEFYKNIKHFSFKSIEKPLSKYNLREHEFKVHREQKCNWLHSPDKMVFYVIPEKILFEKEYIAEKGEILPKRYIYVKQNGFNDRWMKNFQFDYDNLDESRLKQLLDI